jgi:methionine-rich copper-binding protein CopC
MRKWFIAAIVAIILAVVGGGLYFFLTKDKGSNQNTPPPVQTTPVATESISPATEEEKAEETTQNFENIKTPHFVSSTPTNNATLTSGPSKVTINFNFNLGPGSKIIVTADGNNINTPEATKIASDKLFMSQTINPIEPGDYKVTYTACWPDGSCHNGSFGFSVKINQ